MHNHIINRSTANHKGTNVFPTSFIQTVSNKQGRIIMNSRSNVIDQLQKLHCEQTNWPSK